MLDHEEMGATHFEDGLFDKISGLIRMNTWMKDAPIGSSCLHGTSLTGTFGFEYLLYKVLSCQYEAH